MSAHSDEHPATRAFRAALKAWREQQGEALPANLASDWFAIGWNAALRHARESFEPRRDDPSNPKPRDP